MKAISILVGVGLVMLFGFLMIPSFPIGNLFGVELTVANPFYSLFNAPLVTVFGFNITVALIILGLAILCIVVGLLG
jgi:hypothetical protein